MAPEQARGETIDRRADLFSLGSVLYVMCSGRPPFRAPTTLAVLKRVAEDTPRPIREIIPEVPEWLCAIIARLHAKQPQDRFASAQEVADLLARSLSEQPQLGGSAAPAAEPPVVAPSPDPVTTATRESPGPAPAFRPPPRRRLWAATAAALLLLFAGLGLGEATGVTDVRGTIIRLFAPEGTLVVEVDDPGVSVSIDGDAMVITGAGAREIRLKTGQYKVQASKDGKVVRQELVTVTRNGRQVVRVSKEVEPTEAERWERAVARLPAEKQVKAVVLRLRDLNPGFDGKVTPTIEHGVVTALRFKTDEVEDISPLRVLTGLVKVECPGTYLKKGKLSDLTPLCGLRLTHLSCEENPVADLSPLRGMPLTILVAGDTQVSDLSPLQGMRLTGLMLQSTGVKDLSPLRGMPLTWLDLYGLRGVSDISPLQGMPLGYLNLTALPVTDLSVLASMKSLRRLFLESMPVSDLTPLHGLGLKELNFKGTQVTDLSPIKGLSLQKLAFDYQAAHEEFVRSFKGLETINDLPAADFWKKSDGAAAWEKSVAALPPEQQVEVVARRLKELNPGFDGQVKSDIRDGQVTGLAFYTHAVKDLSPLRALPRLESLGCSGTIESQGKVADLSPLRGLPLKTLNCFDNPVSDLSPLRGMPLEMLECYRTSVEDLSPLKGMPLTRLSVASTRVTDLSPLKGMRLTTLWCDKTLVTDLAPLRGMALTLLDVSYSGVSDLAPLKGMPLTALGLSHTPVSDLSPLAGMPLAGLDMLSAKVTDLSPLKGMQLKALRCNFERERDAALLRSLTTLERINDKPAVDFWKEVASQ
jgi:Leucine-rich repeat (LRR) protein